MQDLASEFSKNFPGLIHPDPHSKPLPHPTPERLERKRPGVGTQTLVPLNFSAVDAPLL